MNPKPHELYVVSILLEYIITVITSVIAFHSSGGSINTLKSAFLTHEN